MKSLKYSEILAQNNSFDRSKLGRLYRVVLISNVVINPLLDILAFALRTRGINAEVVCADYDNITQESERFKTFDAAVVFWEVANLVDGLHVTAELMQPEEITAIIDRVDREIVLTCLNLRETPLVLFNRFSSILFSHDMLRNSVLQALCDRLNASLERHVLPNQLLVRLDTIIARVGALAAADFRQYQSSKSLYSVDLFKSYSSSIAPAFLSLAGKARKVMILDCDNTLWGGVLGEDGERGIQLDDSTRQGKVFLEVRKILKGFRHRGILLALCSKNNQEDVDRLFGDRPEMILQESDFVARKVNWNHKADNLRQLSVELNVGLDSFVFVDDSPFEIGLIEKELPEVLCVKVPANLSEYPQLMADLGCEFFSLSQSAEDGRKTEMYLEEQSRSGSKAQFTSIEDYLRSLGLVVQISWNASSFNGRAAQLTQKTNQFNLTTRRYAEADLMRMISDTDYAVITFSVSDKYGDYGVTGLSILKFDKDCSNAIVDTMLMSCRIIGRNIERVFFDYLVRKLRLLGIVTLQAEYLRTPKNSQVSQFYESLGFVSELSTVDAKSYTIVLSDYVDSPVGYIEVKEC